MSIEIIAPDCLPNNIKIIREMRKKSIQEVTKDLDIDRNHYGVVEAEKKNFSGKMVIKALKYYDINFYKMYDVKETRLCPVTRYITPAEIIKKDIKISLEKILKKAGINKSEYNSNEDLIESMKLDRMKSFIKLEILSNLKKDDISCKVINYEILEKNIENDELILKMDIEAEIQKVDMVEFNINFVDHEDVEFAKTMRSVGFQETITVWEEEVDGENVIIDNDKVILGREFKIPLSDNKDEFELKSELPIVYKDEINAKKEKIKNLLDNGVAEVRIQDGIQKVRFKAIRQEVNNLSIVRAIKRWTLEDMHTSLGMQYNAYINLELGNQKMSSKTMWRLVKKARIPLELMINVNEYYERFCRTKGE